MRPSRVEVIVGLVLALPLLAVALWLGTLGVGYGALQGFEGWAVALAFTGFITLLARWRAVGPLSWPLAWLLYVAGLIVTLADAMAWYFQGSSFSVRFFANVRLVNLLTGIHAFPGLAVLVLVVLLGMLVVSAWLLYRCTRQGRSGTPHIGVRTVTLVVLAIIAAGVPSAWQRLGTFVFHYRQEQSLAGTLGSAGAGLLADPDPVPRAVVRAAPGKNLVIIYMESLERIYTDDRIFPGLTPNLDHWRAQGLDFPGYLTFTGADYTIAGLFSSQCGVPYLPSPAHALELGGNDANRTSFQPSLACLGDVLHAAGYEQVFMNGVNLSFADDGAFFHLHGFDQVLGLQQLEDANGNELPRPGWGLYDSDLFRLAATKFGKLAASGKPFNLDVLTIDNHPPHGRPSPGCPKYPANSNDILQAVHCTDHLVGRFLDTISKSPAWKNTIVVVMSDHQSMRNDAWPLYPKWYKRRPLLFILNAGQGRRTMRFYHMDIAPTVLHLMGVRTNATFLAGADRSESNAPGSPLVNDAADVAVLRQASWARAQPVVLCKDGVLIGAADHGVRIGDSPVPMLWRGRRQVALRAHGIWLVEVGTRSVHGAVFSAIDMAMNRVAQSRVSGEQARLPDDLHYPGGGPGRFAAWAAGTSILQVESIGGADASRQFSVDWVGRDGGRTHLADVPRLRDLEIAAPHCASLLQRMNALPTGKTLDLSGRFKATTASLYPPLPRDIRFDKRDALPFEREVGWLKPEIWGSFTVGDYATMGFTLPRDHCHAMDFAFKVHPYIVASRPRLDVQVYANGVPMTIWRFGKQGAGQMWFHMTVSLRTSDPQCRVDLRFVFNRPGASPPPYPKGEDPRRLQLLFLDMRPVPPVGVAAAR